MGAAAAYPLNYKFTVRKGINPACSSVTVQAHVSEIASRVTVPNFESAKQNGRHITYVSLKPRTFVEIADHFAKVATQVQWPTDEPDIE